MKEFSPFCSFSSIIPWIQVEACHAWILIDGTSVFACRDLKFIFSAGEFIGFFAKEGSKNVVLPWARSRHSMQWYSWAFRHQSSNLWFWVPSFAVIQANSFFPWSIFLSNHVFACYSPKTDTFRTWEFVFEPVDLSWWL